MTLDFNQLRLDIQREYNSIVKFLNQEYDDTEDKLQIEGIGIERLSNKLSNLRVSISMLMCAYTDTPEMIDNISSKAELSTFEIR